MAIELPKFENTYGLSLSACGKVKSLEHGGEQINEKETRVAWYQAPSGRVFIRAWIIRKKATYLHVDCALRKNFPKGKIPKVTHKKRDVLEIIESVQDKGIDLNINAFFDVPLLDLPENGLIRSLSGEQKSVDMCLKLTGAELSISGAPLTRIRWNIREEGKKSLVHVQMRGGRATRVCSTYLSESWDWINEQFIAFMLGKRKDAAS